MSNKKAFVALVLLCLILSVGGLIFYKRYNRAHDVVVMGSVNSGDGIGGLTIGFIDCLRKKFAVGYVRDGGFHSKDLPKEVAKILRNPIRGRSNVLIFVSALFHPHGRLFPKLPPAEVKIALSMIESTRIPKEWTKILNREFDAVIVPDPFLVEVYRNCDVKIPIFVLPLGMYLEPFLERSQRHMRPQDRPFAFGYLGSYLPRKNQTMLLQAFAQAFGNNPNVRLVMNGRSAEMNYLDTLTTLHRTLALDNVDLTKTALSRKDYLEKMASLDCYVSPSRGEGFSLQPREALALGIPCIVTDNTAQATICNSGYVRAVACTPIKAAYQVFRDLPDDLGDQFECTACDFAQAMREVYENYEAHAMKAFAAGDWVRQYLYESLAPFYETLVLPQEVVLSSHDVIENGILYTTSPQLKQKYERIMAKASKSD